MSPHTHDGIDWVARLADLHRADEANAPALRAVAARLVESLPAPQPIVFDVGCGAGGMSAALAEAMAGRAARSGGQANASGMLVLVDAVPELLAAAAEAARDAVGVAGVVELRTAQLDLARTMTTGPGQHVAAQPPAAEHTACGAAHGSSVSAAEDRPGLGGPAGSGETRAADNPVGGSAAGLAGGSAAGLAGGSVSGLGGGSGTGVAGASDVIVVGAEGFAGSPSAGLPAADLIWASNVAHHLPDQRQAVMTLVGWLAPGGCLALSEGGLSMRCLPWDLGIGAPGLQDRLIAAHGTWFRGMRTQMPGAVRLPVGWNQVLADSGLTGVTAFSYLVDVPAPLTDVGRAAVVSWLAWMTRATDELLDPADVATVYRLLDEDDPAYVGRRDDVFLLKASTVHLGWR